MGRAMSTPNKFDRFYFWEFLRLCHAVFGENRSRNTTVRVRTDGYTDTLTDANRFSNLSMLWGTRRTHISRFETGLRMRINSKI